MGKEHLRDFTDFGVAFDNYGSTDSQENRELVTRVAPEQVQTMLAYSQRTKNESN